MQLADVANLSTLTLIGQTLAILGGLAGGWWKLRSIHANELAHIERGLERIEKKIDEHLMWHAEQN